MEIMGPEEVLRKGGVEWKAELVETKRVEDEAKRVGQVKTEEEVPNHAVITSVVPKETGVPKASVSNSRQDTVIFSQSVDAAPPAAEILASDTINMNIDNADPSNIPHFPCPRVFLHLMVKETGVPIPPAGDLSSTKWPRFFSVAENVFGPLSAVQATSAEEADDPDSAPIHLTLERLYLGGVPTTATSMVLPMLVMLFVSWWGVRPLLEGALPQAATHGKDE